LAVVLNNAWSLSKQIPDLGHQIKLQQ